MAGRNGYRRRQRLHSRDIATLLAAGHRRRATSVSVHVRSNGLLRARLGLIVPKRYLRRAVDRNRVKRLLREWFRMNQQALEGNDLLIRVTAPVARFESLVSDVNRLFAPR